MRLCDNVTSTIIHLNTSMSIVLRLLPNHGLSGICHGAKIEGQTYMLRVIC